MLTVFIINIIVVSIVVIIHYEFLYRFTLIMPELKIRHRFRIVLGVCAALTAMRWRYGFLPSLTTICISPKVGAISRVTSKAP